MKKIRGLPVIFMLLVASCSIQKRVATAPVPVASQDESTYRSSITKKFDLVHTSLEVSFDWNLQRMYGKALITLHPHFYPDDTVVLNARGMTINKVLSESASGFPLAYIYRNDSLIIALDKTYNKEDKFSLFIDYTSSPGELQHIGGSDAIISDKGLYFINPDGSNPLKPRQIWTQGETTASSVWFPTIDAPNQKMTQEIAITIDTSFVTLSNGKMISSKANHDGTRTDVWKQSLPHAPYLAMMAIGKFAVVKDEWNGKDVSYYVEPYFEKYARNIFGNTPEMIAFFSKKLNVDFPWDKYAQVVVRDYVSGAMENTSATLHGDFMQLSDRELLDFNADEYISHELFHQWFGDLVTCESWSNVPLNESFASYGEYLWNEYKYGREEADYFLQEELNSYLREARSKQVNMIRYHYDKPEDMFDRHSYEKGANILHMLRKHTGDEAFFASLNLYLTRNSFKSVEIHDLRLAFEEITGEDLNWFFNQWFLASGHPQLDISYQWNDALKKMEVTIAQVQPRDVTPLYRIPLAVDVYAANRTDRYHVVLDQAQQKFEFPCHEKPFLVNADAEKMVLCTKSDHHTMDEWIYMFRHAKVYADKSEAITAIAGNYIYPSEQADVVIEALGDPFWNIRYFALQHLEPVIKGKKEIKAKLEQMVSSDVNATARAAALRIIIQYYPEDQEALIEKALNDSSYGVAGTALEAILSKDAVRGMQHAKKMEDLNSKFANSILLGVYAEYGSDEQASYVNKVMSLVYGYESYQAIGQYAEFLKRCRQDTTLTHGINLLKKMGETETVWFIRYAVLKSLYDLQQFFKRADGKNEEMEQLAGDAISELMSKEKDQRVLQALRSDG